MTKIDTRIQTFIAPSDIISMLNMTSGFISIICSFNSNFKMAAIFMIIAIMFDSADGWVARKANRNDELGFGKNIDSISDAVSFGVAPAIFVYASINPNNIIVGLVSLLIVICGVLRLTRYNVISQHLNMSGFIGFPIPGIAFILATLYLSGIHNSYLVLILSIIVSLLMISNIYYPKFDNIPVLIVSGILIVLMILPINLSVYNINIPALILLLFCLYYMIINMIKK